MAVAALAAPDFTCINKQKALCVLVYVAAWPLLHRHRQMSMPSPMSELCI